MARAGATMVDMTEPRRCIAPTGDGEHLCGRPATEERELESFVIHLCGEHAAILDDEAADDSILPN